MVSGMRQLATVAAVLIVLAVPVVTWWLVGDQSTTSQDAADYVLRPPFRFSNRATRALESGALAVTVAAAAVLVVASASHSFGPRWWSASRAVAAVRRRLGHLPYDQSG
jgi:hypothetical protein